MANPQCPHCGSTEIDQDPSRGDVVCMQCGSVLEESVIVSEVQYAQDCSGATRAIGQLVRAEGSVPSGFNLGHSYGINKESRLVTLHNAKKKISNLASHLKLPEHFIDIAHNFYKMALMRKLTQGRKNTHVIGACVYMVCRKEGTHHMLLDLSDVLQVNVYEIGKTYLKLSTALCINTPAIDPSLYILRFAHQLEFGDKTHEVSITATRLVQRMKRDWMHTGRRPSGLCGAALLVAARLHNFSRSVDNVIKVVKVCQATVKKRLIEFSDTPSSRLTLEQFMTIDLEEEQDPPAFKNARKKKSLEIDDETRMKATKQISKFQDIIEQALEKARQKKFARYSRLTETAAEKNSSDKADPEQQFLVNNTIEAINEVIRIENGEAVNNATPELQKLLTPSTNSSVDSGIVDTSMSSIFTFDGKTTDSMGSSEVIPGSEENEQLDITGLDDAEIDSYIMDEDETKSKTRLWLLTNEDFLQEQKEKEEKRLKEEAENANKEQKKKRKRSRSKIQANTTEEAIAKMLQQKKISLKLDYSVLRNLNGEAVPTVDASETVAEEPEVTETRPAKRVRTPKPKPVPAPLPSSIRQGISALISKARNNNPPIEKDMEAEATSSTEAPVISLDEEKNSTVIPSANTDIETVDIVDKEDEEEEEEEADADDDAGPSIAELLSKHRGEDGEEEEFCDYDYDMYDD